MCKLYNLTTLFPTIVLSCFTLLIDLFFFLYNRIFLILALVSQTLASRPKRHKVKGSLIRLFKAKEGSKKHEAIRMLKYPRFANPAQPGIALHVPAQNRNKDYVL